ncbi:MAG TPA: hypothetical protein VFB45_12930 [Pseudolabrys sp.]|nr:hypothetical protein [Pseudolabrys sp.]
MQKALFLAGAMSVALVLGAGSASAMPMAKPLGIDTATVQPENARLVCNRWGRCWHVWGGRRWHRGWRRW